MLDEKGLIEWSHAIADACIKTTIAPEDVKEACAAFVRLREGKQTNYEKYFGTAEKVVKSIGHCYDQCDFCLIESDDECESYPKCSMTFLEWLRDDSYC